MAKHKRTRARAAAPGRLPASVNGRLIELSTASSATPASTPLPRPVAPALVAKVNQLLARRRQGGQQGKEPNHQEVTRETNRGNRNRDRVQHESSEQERTGIVVMEIDRPHGVAVRPRTDRYEMSDPRTEQATLERWQPLLTGLGIPVIGLRDLPTGVQRLELDGITWTVERCDPNRTYEVPQSVNDRMLAARAAQVPFAWWLWGEEQFDSLSVTVNPALRESRNPIPPPDELLAAVIERARSMPLTTPNDPAAPAPARRSPGERLRAAMHTAPAGLACIGCSHQHELPDAPYCTRCGVAQRPAVPRTCRRCGSANPWTARGCGACGTPFIAESAGTPAGTGPQQCTGCGARNPLIARFCAMCGARQRDPLLIGVIPTTSATRGIWCLLGRWLH
jgi:hypothetical protein